jgi:hypothetical protein
MAVQPQWDQLHTTAEVAVAVADLPRLDQRAEHPYTAPAVEAVEAASMLPARAPLVQGVQVD